MTNTQNQTLSQKVGAWIQRIAILSATIWGVYTFVYKEMIIPQTAPVNITMNLDIKKITLDNLISSNLSDDLIPVEMKISARNPSTRPVYLLPSVWIAYGEQIESNLNGIETDLITQFNSFMTETPDELLPTVQTYAYPRYASIVATGGLFADTFLNPGEVSMRTLIIYVPSGMYDLLDISALMPTIQAKDKAILKWKFDEDTRNLKPVMYDIHPDGSLTPMQADKDGSYTNEALGLQMATSMSQFSLR